MASQAQITHQAPESTFEFAVMTINDPKAQPRQFAAAVHRLLDTVAQNGALKGRAQGILLRAFQHGKITQPGIRQRYDAIMRRQVRRPSNNNDRPTHMRKGPPAARLAKLASIRSESRRTRNKMQGKSPDAPTKKEGKGGKGKGKK